MAAIPYVFVEKNTATDHTNASYTDLADCTISSASFTVGKRYLLLVTAQHSNITTTGICGLRVEHGTTAFAESESEQTVPSAGDYIVYTWMTVWTAVTGEGITLQGMVEAGGRTQRVNFVSLLAIQLDDYLTENTDWFFNERANDDALSTTPMAGATVTFTPATASQDWLVLSSAQISHGDVTTAALSELVRSGEASSSTPASNIEAQGAASNLRGHFLARVFTLGAASNTFTEQTSTSSGTAHTRLHGALFALNLHRFLDHGAVYTDASAAITATSGFGTELQTATVTPDGNTSMFILSSVLYDENSTTRLRFRNQTYVDGGAQADQPAGQTTAAYGFRPGNGHTAAQEPMTVLTVMAQTGGSTYRTDVDGHVESTVGTPAALYRTVVMWSAELASGSESEFGSETARVAASEEVQPITVGVGAVEAG
jgi:hypothetical protein